MVLHQVEIVLPKAYLKFSTSSSFVELKFVYFNITNFSRHNLQTDHINDEPSDVKLFPVKTLPQPIARPTTAEMLNSNLFDGAENYFV